MNTEEPKKCCMQETFEAAAATHDENDLQARAIAAAEIAAREQLANEAREIKTYLQNLADASRGLMEIRERFYFERYKKGGFTRSHMVIDLVKTGAKNYQEWDEFLDSTPIITIELIKKNTFFSKASEMAIRPRDDSSEYTKSESWDLEASMVWVPSHKGPVMLEPICREVGKFLGRILTKDQLAMIEVNMRTMVKQQDQKLPLPQ